MPYYYIILPAIIGIIGIAIAIIASKGVLYDRRGKGHKFFKRRGWWIIGLSFLVIVVTAIQAYLSNEEAEEEKAELQKLQKSYADSVKAKVESSTKAITDNLAISFKEQGLAYESGKVQIRSDALKIQLTTDSIYHNLGDARKNVNEIQKNAESILNPITPMDVIIEYSIKVPTNYLTQLYPYITPPLPNQNIYFTEVKLNSLTKTQQSYVSFFNNIGFSKYTSHQNSIIGSTEWEKSFITIEENEKDIWIQGNAKNMGDSTVISVWKIMNNVFIRNKDYANIQNYKSLLGWYLTFTYPDTPPEIKLINISLLKFRTGHERSQKIFISSLPSNIEKEKTRFFEKKITLKDFRHEYQGP